VWHEIGLRQVETRNVGIGRKRREWAEGRRLVWWIEGLCLENDNVCRRKGIGRREGQKEGGRDHPVSSSLVRGGGVLQLRTR